MSLVRLIGHDNISLALKPNRSMGIGDDGKMFFADAEGGGRVPTLFDRAVPSHAGAMAALSATRGEGASRDELYAAARSSGADTMETLNALAIVERVTLFSFMNYWILRTRDDDGKTFIEVEVSGRSDEAPKFDVEDAELNRPMVLSRMTLLRREGDSVLAESGASGCRLLLKSEEAAMLATALMGGANPSERIAALPEASRRAARQLVALMINEDLARPASGDRSAPARDDENDADENLWDFHDWLMHSRSRLGHAFGEFGGAFPYVGVRDPLPALKPLPEGERIALAKPDMNALYQDDVGFAAVQDGRVSVRFYDEDKPLSIEQLGTFLYRSARVIDEWTQDMGGLGEDDPKTSMEFARRPYPSGGGSWELEIYLTVDKCEGLTSGFYFYDPKGHAVIRMRERDSLVEHALATANAATAGIAKPHVVAHISARFGRISWKYRAIAYSVALKNAGALYQTMYLVATAMGIAPCGLGSGDVIAFAKLSGVDPRLESSVGDFALGSAPPDFHRRVRENLSRSGFPYGAPFADVQDYVPPAPDGERQER